jgi:hypothetical protein
MNVWKSFYRGTWLERKRGLNGDSYRRTDPRHAAPHFKMKQIPLPFVLSMSNTVRYLILGLFINRALFLKL